MRNYEKTYMMLGGTFLPAFIGVGVVSLMSKKPLSFASTKVLMTFAVASAVGGFVTAQIIKKTEVELKS